MVGRCVAGCTHCWMYFGKHESRYWPYLCSCSAFSWALSVRNRQSLSLLLAGRQVIPAGLMMGASSFPIVSLWACLMFGMPEVSTASSFRRQGDVAKALVAVAEYRPFRTAFAAARSGLENTRCGAIVNQWPAKCQTASAPELYHAHRASVRARQGL